MNIKQLVKDAHDNAKTKGWHDEDRTFGELIALCHSELSESLEEFRAGRGLNEVYYTGDIGIGKPATSDRATDFCRKPEGVPIELADCVIRIFDMFGLYEMDIDSMQVSEVDFDIGVSFAEFISAIHYSLSMAYFHGHNIKVGCVILMTAVKLIERYANERGIDLDKAIRIKMEYNKLRSHKHGGKVL